MGVIITGGNITIADSAVSMLVANTAQPRTQATPMFSMLHTWVRGYHSMHVIYYDAKAWKAIMLTQHLIALEALCHATRCIETGREFTYTSLVDQSRMPAPPLSF